MTTLIGEPASPHGQGIQELIDRAQRLMERVQRLREKLISNINRFIQWLPEAMADKVRDGVRKLESMLQRLWEEIKRYLRHAGNPETLWQAGETWLKSVGDTAADVAALMIKSRREISNYWEGDAVTAYKEVLTDQESAFAAIAEVTKKISHSLNQMAGAILTFWGGIVAALATFVGSFAAAVGAASTGAGIPLALIMAVGAVTSALAAIAPFAGAATLSMSTAIGAMNDLRDSRIVNHAFPVENWPEAKTQPGKWQPD